MTRLTVLLTCWEGWRSQYRSEHATALARMLRHYLKIPHRIVLLTDMVTECEGVDEILPIPAEPKGLGWVQGANCFRRLRFFDPEYNKQFDSEWLMSIDLDTVILGDITKVVEYAMSQDYGACLLRSKHYTGPGTRPFNGGMFFIKSGTNGHVWSSFDGRTSPAIITQTGWIGSDQVWMCLQMPDAPVFGKADGVYFHGEYRERKPEDPMPLVINYAGPYKPWSKTGKKQSPELWSHWNSFA